MRVGKRTARLIREAAVLGFVNGAWSATGPGARIPPATAVFAEVVRSARDMPDLYPTLSRVELPEDDPAVAWQAGQDAERLAMLRALIDDA